MNDIKKYDAPLPVLPEILAGSMPIPIPQVKWEDGIIPNIFRNWKRRQIAAATELEANIAENKTRMMTAYLNGITQLMTFSATIAKQHKDMELDLYIKGQLAQQETWKTKSMEIEFLTAEITYKKMKQEVEDDSPG